MNPTMPQQQPGGTMPPPQQAPPTPPMGGGGQPGMQSTGSHGDPVSNVYTTLQQQLMPLVGKVPGMDMIIQAINQQHIKYLAGAGAGQPPTMPGKPAGRMGQ